MKRQFPLLFLLLLLLLPVQTHGMTAVYDDVLRLHIRANSDSAVDQAVKLRVRDALRPLFAAKDSYTDARAFLLANGALLQSTAEAVLRENGMDYGAQLILGRDTFPDRTYDGQTFPAGTYDALIVSLGRGEGQNWWCVLFPPLCIVTENGEPVDMKEVRLESSILKWFRQWRADRSKPLPAEE